MKTLFCILKGATDNFFIWVGFLPKVILHSKFVMENFFDSVIKPNDTKTVHYSKGLSQKVSESSVIPNTSLKTP